MRDATQVWRTLRAERMCSTTWCFRMRAERGLPVSERLCAGRATDKSKLPVMFWIHGGGYSGGASSEPRHNGDFLPLKGVVLVTINYRLGVFGFLATSELAKEGGRRGRELRADGHGGRARSG